MNKLDSQVHPLRQDVIIDWGFRYEMMEQQDVIIGGGLTIGTSIVMVIAYRKWKARSAMRINAILSQSRGSGINSPNVVAGTSYRIGDFTATHDSQPPNSNGSSPLSPTEEPGANTILSPSSSNKVDPPTHNNPRDNPDTGKPNNQPLMSGPGPINTTEPLTLEEFRNEFLKRAYRILFQESEFHAAYLFAFNSFQKLSDLSKFNIETIIPHTEARKLFIDRLSLDERIKFKILDTQTQKVDEPEGNSKGENLQTNNPNQPHRDEEKARYKESRLVRFRRATEEPDIFINGKLRSARKGIIRVLIAAKDRLDNINIGSRKSREDS